MNFSEQVPIFTYTYLNAISHATTKNGNA